VRLKLRDAVRIDLLAPDDTVLASRDWAATWTWEPGATNPTDQVLSVEWRTPVELAAAVEYRLLVTPTGSTGCDVFSFLIDEPTHPPTGANGWLVRRTSGVWTEDETRRAEMTIRITGL